MANEQHNRNNYKNNSRTIKNAKLNKNKNKLKQIETNESTTTTTIRRENKMKTEFKL